MQRETRSHVSAATQLASPTSVGGRDRTEGEPGEYSLARSSDTCRGGRDCAGGEQGLNNSSACLPGTWRGRCNVTTMN